jgi:AcrR family transcriptional regulator
MYGNQYRTLYEGSTNPTMPSTATTRSRLGLSRERIIGATAAVLAEHGLPGLTMRAVAERLGTGTMTLYGYFRDKDELLDALIDSKTAELEIRRSSGPWRRQLRTLMLGLHHQLVENRYLVELRLRRPLMSPGALRWTEVGLEALGEAGLSPGDAAKAFRGLFVYTFGHATFLPEGDPDEVVRRAHATLMALPPDGYPAVTAAASEMASTLAGSDAFEYGLDRLLDGIEAEVRRGQ